MPKILAPRLELFRGIAYILTKPDEGISEAVWVEIWQARPYECFSENCPNR